MKRKLFLLLCALLTMIGVTQVKAYTVDDLTSDGWTQVTAASITGVSDNYYVLVDANSSAYVMSAEADHYRPCYKTIADPKEHPSFVWNLEGSNNTFQLKSFATGAYFKQSSGWNTSVGDGRNGSTASLQFTLSEGKYSIQCVGQGLVGHWNDDGAAVASDGENIAANKAAVNAPGFYLYSISKETYNAAIIAARAAGVSSATKASPVEVTSYIQNADWSGDWGAWEFTCTSSGNIQWGQKTLESWNANNVVVKQVLTGVPNGLYKLTADVISGPGATKAAYVFATGDATVNSAVVSAEASANNYTTMSNEVAGNTLTADNVYVSGNAITVGMNQSTGWVVADNFKLYYYGPTIKGNAVEFTTGDAVTAGQWYYFDVAASGDYAITTTNELTNIVYTTNGNILIEDEATVTTNPTAVTALTAGRIYFKASAAATITITPDTYTYEVSAPTASIADASYIQSLTTISFDFTSAANTNDPGATFALLNGSAAASLKLAGSEVATGTLSLSGKVLTATFSEVSLAQGSTYTVEIAANVVGYEDQAANTAISTSFKTGVIANGVYYFKKNDADIYITRGGWYGTEAVADNFGLSFEATLQSDGTYTLKNVDHSLAANADKFLKCDGSTYTDQSAFNWTIEATDGGYYLRPSNTEYMAATAQGEYNYSYLSKTTEASSAYVWTLLSKSEYAAAIAAAKNSQATAIATAAGISATTVAELESALAANYGATDMTSSITNAALTANTTGWTQVKYNGVTFKDADANGITAEIWNSTGGVKQDIEDLPAGLYKVTVVATWRPGNLAAATRVGAEANTTAWMYANTGTATNITQLKSWYEGGATINSRADLVTNKANYTNTTYVYVAEDETLTIGLASPSFCVEPWFPFFDWTLTRYEAKATPAEKTALADAISDAESNTLGFEDGEYAPYNNVDALTKLAAAKSINPETASGEAVVNATTALTGATWTANAEELNAVYDGNFAIQPEHTTGPTALAGWNNPAGIRQLIKNTETYPGLNTASAKAAVFAWGGTTMKYGETDGYTIPLKGHAIYELSFKTCGWIDGDMGYVNVDVKNASDEGLQTVRTATATKRINGENPWDEFKILFVTGEAGNYKLGMWTSKHTTFTDIVLKKAASQTLTFNDDAAMPAFAPGTYPSVRVNRTLNAGENVWNSLVLPFDYTNAEWAVRELTSSTEDRLSFSVVEGGVMTAGKPYLVRPNEAVTYIEAENVEVVTTPAAVETDKYSFIPVFAPTTITGDGTNYFVATGTNKLYCAKADIDTNGYRAYFHYTGTNSSARSVFLNFDEVDPTAINIIEATEAESGALKDGKYIIDNKVVIVKNGVKYSANGQKLN